jgi:hypothetical protein
MYVSARIAFTMTSFSIGCEPILLLERKEKCHEYYQNFTSGASPGSAVNLFV